MKIPAFTAAQPPQEFINMDSDTVLVTQELEKDGRTVLVPVVKVVDHKELNGLNYNDFNIQELIEAGKEPNLRPCAPISMQQLSAFDGLEKSQSVLIDKMDYDILSKELVSQSSQSAEPSQPVEPSKS